MSFQNLDFTDLDNNVLRKRRRQSLNDEVTINILKKKLVSVLE
ncbi:hypothetical protein NSQ96_16785 [Caldifermentibacillus hisashii]